MTDRSMRFAALLGAFVALLVGCGVTAPGTSAWPVVADEPCAVPACVARFEFADPAGWRWSDAGGCAALELLGGSSYRPSVRSPSSIALLRDVEVADFDLDVDVQQTGRDYAHRDLCLFFGYESPTRFYYVHLAPAPDANAHNVFLVADAPRRPLAPVAARGVDWGRGWHHVRVERRVGAGTIAVFWDRSLANPRAARGFA